MVRMFGCPTLWHRISAALVACSALAFAFQAHAAEFPRISPAAQRQMDDSRKAILLDELKAEKQKLANAQAELLAALVAKKPQSELGAIEGDVERAKKNIEALNRELAMTQQGPKTAPQGGLPGAKVERVSLKAHTEQADNTRTPAPWWDVYARNRSKQ